MTTTSKKGWTVLGIFLLVAFTGFAVFAFRSSLTPYVSYREAQAATRTVQDAGALEKGLDVTLMLPGSLGRSGSVNVRPASDKSPKTSSPSGRTPARTHLARSSKARICSRGLN